MRRRLMLLKLKEHLINVHKTQTLIYCYCYISVRILKRNSTPPPTQSHKF